MIYYTIIVKFLFFRISLSGSFSWEIAS